MRQALALATILALATPASADVFSELAAAKTLRCTFPTGNFGAWDEGKFSTGKTTDTMTSVFHSIDRGEGTARLIGNVGAEDVMVVGLNFVEVTTSGNMNITTVFPIQVQSKTGKGGLPKRGFAAVLSRHFYGFDNAVPTQY